MTLSEIDRNLLERCLDRKVHAWEDFVDRFMGLVVHVVNHTALARGVQLTHDDRDDLCSEVFLGIIQDDFRLLRHFRGQSSLATYLTVIARRIAVKTIIDRIAQNNRTQAGATGDPVDSEPNVEERLGTQEEVERLLEGLEPRDADVVRMYHLEGKNYREISTQVGVAENSIGPILSRARSQMREQTAE